MIRYFVFLVLIASVPIQAHPGRTASDGCHYCRTNCDKWGVEWNQRHCHNGKLEEFMGLDTNPIDHDHQQHDVETKPEGPTTSEKPVEAVS